MADQGVGVLTWVDLLALCALALGLALGVRLGLAFGLAALLGVLLYLFAPVGIWAALGLGFLLGLSLKTLPPLPNPLEALGGGLGGLALGLFLAFALWTAFPAEWAPSAGALRYPSVRLPTPLYEALKESPFAPTLFEWTSQTPLLRKAFLNLR